MVTTSTASVWVQTARGGVVTVRAGERRWSAPTFRVLEFHYALVVCDGLEPGTSVEYEVLLDDERVWPQPDSDLPPPRLSTLDPDRPLRLAFGSCRTSVPHDAAGNASNGVDALRAYALDALTKDRDEWPTMIAFLGDQVYADETSDAMREFIDQRRGLDEPPGEELKDYTEYAHLYRLAWSDPVNRWLLASVPSVMIFDDHDVRDDWNTSRDWHREMNELPWWHDRIVGALSSYWVYQHCGNLSPDDLAADQIWQLIAGHDPAAGECDVTEVVMSLAERVDKDPTVYRWSYTVDLAPNRLVMIDSRAARDLDPDNRRMLDADEMRWLQTQLTGDVENLFLGTSLPFLLLPGIHDLEALNEAMSQGAWGRAAAWLGERVRRAVDLEHWAAFQDSFHEVYDAVVEVATGRRGTPPRTITFLSGDVHNSFVASLPEDALGSGASRVLQAVCSPIRNPLPRFIRAGHTLAARRLAAPMHFIVKRTKKVTEPEHRWKILGPWFDNNLATVIVQPDGLELRWESGVIDDEQTQTPRLELVSRVMVTTEGDDEISENVGSPEAGLESSGR